MACVFCGRRSRPSLRLDRPAGRVLERVVQPIRSRCHAMLTDAGDKGRKVKTTGETWYLGHGIGLFDAPEQSPES